MGLAASLFNQTSPPSSRSAQVCADGRVISLARSQSLPSLLRMDQLAWLTCAGDKRALQAGWLGCVLLCCCHLLLWAPASGALPSHGTEQGTSLPPSRAPPVHFLISGVTFPREADLMSFRPSLLSSVPCACLSEGCENPWKYPLNHLGRKIIYLQLFKVELVVEKILNPIIN